MSSAQLQNNTIAIIKYPGKCENNLFMAQMIRISILVYIEKLCLITVINTVNYQLTFIKITTKQIRCTSQQNNIVLLRDVFHIGLAIGPRPAVLA
jgi:hypothetical protein